MLKKGGLASSYSPDHVGVDNDGSVHGNDVIPGGQRPCKEQQHGSWLAKGEAMVWASRAAMSLH